MLRKLLVLILITVSFYSVSLEVSNNVRASVLRAGAPSYDLSHADILSGNKLMAQIDSANYTFDLNTITHEDIEGGVKNKWTREGVNYGFEKVIGLLSGVIGGVAVLMISYGGFLMLSSAGSETMYDDGKRYIQYTVIGLILALCAYIMVNAVQLLIKSIYG